MNDVKSIKLNILWIDDDSTIFEDIKDNINDKYDNINFECHNEVDDIQKLLKKHMFDILIFDNNLRQRKKGINLIQDVRQHNEFGEILLYSGKKISEETEYLQIKKTNRKNLEGEIIESVETIYSYISSYSNLRGNFIIASINIENILESIIIESIFKNNENVFKERILNKGLLVYMQKYNLLVGYLKRLDIGNDKFIDKHKDSMDILGSMPEDIIHMRNMLAHSKINKKNQIEAINRVTKNTSLNVEWYKNAREKIAKHRENLIQIKDVLEKNANKIKYISNTK